MALHRITAKLAGMRKAQEFVVYPTRSDATQLEVQSDRCFGAFDRTTGVGRINWRGSNYKTSLHLAAALGGEAYTFPRAFVLQAQEMRPNSGDEIGPGVRIA